MLGVNLLLSSFKNLRERERERKGQRGGEGGAERIV